VLAALLRLEPPIFYSQDPNSDVVKELGAIASALGRACDSLELLIRDFLPDRTTTMLDLWEGVAGLPVRNGDDAALRRARILARLLRSKGYTTARIQRLLAGLLDCDPSGVLLTEATRATIEAALTATETPPLAIPIPSGAPGLTRSCYVPWPDLVDADGVVVTIQISACLASRLTITLHHAGRSWIVPNNNIGFWGTRTLGTATAFLGAPAAGPWFLSIVRTPSFGPSPTLLTWSLRVSNDLDARSIYYFFVQRDPVLAPSVNTDIARTQAQLVRSAAAELEPHVCETSDLLCDNTQSLTDREPLGV